MEHDFHRELKFKVYGFMTTNKWETYTEYCLPNRRVADVISVSANNKIAIIEVKTTLRGYLLHEAYEKYQPYANVVYVAAPDSEVCNISWDVPIFTWVTSEQRVGILAIAPRRIHVLKQACPYKLPAGRQSQMIENLRTIRSER